MWLQTSKVIANRCKGLAVALDAGNSGDVTNRRIGIVVFNNGVDFTTERTAGGVRVNDKGGAMHLGAGRLGQVTSTSSII